MDEARMKTRLCFLFDSYEIMSARCSELSHKHRYPCSSDKEYCEDRLVFVPAWLQNSLLSPNKKQLNWKELNWIIRKRCEIISRPSGYILTVSMVWCLIRVTATRSELLTAKPQEEDTGIKMFSIEGRWRGSKQKKILMRMGQFAMYLHTEQ